MVRLELNAVKNSKFIHQPKKILSRHHLIGGETRNPSTTMSDDPYDDLSGSYDPFYYEDPISERALVFHHVAKLTDEVIDPEVKELCMTVLRKLNFSIRVPSGEVRSIDKTKNQPDKM